MQLVCTSIIQNHAKVSVLLSHAEGREASLPPPSPSHQSTPRETAQGVDEAGRLAGTFGPN